MGHCDSSAQLGCDGEVLGAGSGAAGAAAAREESGGVAAAGKSGQTSAQRSAKSLGAWALLALLRLYMLLLAPFTGGACKFYPSCSNYAYEAVSRHGARRGSVLTIKRLLRCRPFTQGGFDPVPEELEGPKSSTNDGAEVAAKAATHQATAEPARNLRGLELRQ
ncbi:MAG: membrane protein insertion efficiency factor YidD [Candidatus Acidiferrales bacterium]